MLHCRPLGAQYHLGLPEAENPHDTALFQTIAFTDEVKTQVATFSGKATWPTWQALLGCIVLCIAYLANFLPCFKLFYNILHCTCLGIFSQTSVGPCASEYFVCSNLKDTSDKPNMIVAASKCTPEKQSCIGMWFIFAQTKGLAVFDGS